MTRTAKLHAAVGAVAPIVGISIGRWSDRSTWRVHFKPTAEREHRVAAQAVLDAFEPDAAAVDTPADKLSRLGLTVEELRALLG